jgi:hypothetical protein
MVDHAEAVCQCRRFVDVVRDQHDGDAHGLPQFGELSVELAAGWPVDRRKWFIEQENCRFACERARHGHALLLAAGERRWPPLLEAFEMNEREKVARSLQTLVRRVLRLHCRARSCAEIARSSETRIQPVADAAADRAPAWCRARPCRCISPGRRGDGRGLRSSARSWSFRCPRGRSTPAARLARRKIPPPAGSARLAKGGRADRRVYACRVQPWRRPIRLERM